MFCLTGYGSVDCGKKFNNCSNFAGSRSWHSWSARYTECPYADVLLLFTKGDVSNFCTSSQTWTCLMQWICFNILSPGRIMYKVALVSEYFLCKCLKCRLFKFNFVRFVTLTFVSALQSSEMCCWIIFSVFVILFCTAKQGTFGGGGGDVDRHC